MCHAKLKIDFGRHVNFLHGQNGSGKSAILAALQICLGAQARKTHRASSLGGLVRHDTASGRTITHALVKVTLTNARDDGYRYDEYGESISIERTIFKSKSGGGFKLRSHKGRVVSTSRQDLYQLLDQLNIQVDNPVAVLDQEEAKKFLMGKAQDKYNFFLKATELERVDRVYSTTVDQVQELEGLKERLSTTLDRQKLRLGELEAHYKEYQALQKLKARESKQMAQYGWAIYNEGRTEVEDLDRVLQGGHEKLAKRKAELEQLEQAAKASPDQAKQHGERIAQLSEQAQELQIRREWEKEQLKQVLQPFKVKQRQLQGLEPKQAKAQKALETAQIRLEELRDEMIQKAGNAQKEAARRTQQLRETEEDLAQCRQQVDPLRQAMAKARQEYEQVEPHVQDAKQAVKRLEGKVQNVESQVNELQTSATSLAVFGRRVPALVKAIQQTKFQGPVVGPIGQYLKVVDGKDKYVQAAQQAIGFGSMDRFIVTSTQDRQTLNRLRQKVGCGTACGIFQSIPARRHPIPAPPPGVETVATVLQIKDDLVFNTLVDQVRIETKALCPNKKQSEEVLLERNGNKYSIRGGVIQQVFLMDDGSYWTVKNGSLSLISNDNRRNNVQLIGVDKTKALRQAQVEAQTVREELQRARQDLSRKESEHTGFQRQWSQAKAKIRKNDERVEMLTERAGQLRMEIDTAVDSSMDTAGYEENVQAAQESLDKVMEEQSALQADIEQSKPLVEERNRAVKETSELLDNAKAAIESVQDQLTQIMDTQTQHESDVAKKRAKVEKLQKEVDRVTEDLKALEEKSEKHLGKARRLQFDYNALQVKEETGQASSQEATPEALEEIQPPANFTGDSEGLQARIVKTREKIREESEKKKLGDEVEAYEKYVRAKKVLDGQRAQVTEIDDKVGELHKDLQARKSRWASFRKHLSKKTGQKFSTILSLNKYSGKVDFDHGNQTLDLQVSKEGQAETTTKDLKALR